MKQALLLAYHFPPHAGSSGPQRTLRFAQYLPSFGWEPHILTAHPRAYPETSAASLSQVPPDLEVLRAPAWDTARHFSLLGRYPRMAALPDRWVSWWPGAVLLGLRAIRRLRPQVIWSTYPIATAHLIGATLHRLTGIPWVADFRDPMISQDYPTDPAMVRSFARIERLAARHAAQCVFTTHSAVAHMAAAYPETAARCCCIENGYDEGAFQGLDPGLPPLNPGRFTLLHSGIVYPSERDPTALFQALRDLIDRRVVDPAALCVRFRASMHDRHLQALIDRFNLVECVELAPPLPYREALQEMIRADTLLLLQASNCNTQVPAKLYEYLRAHRPILALTDPAGATAQTLATLNSDNLVRWDDPKAIADLLTEWMAGQYPIRKATPDAIASASREGRTRQLAGVFDRVTAP
ncbi:MAG: glycosyltransferase [Pseudomonadota bacterium]